MGRHGLGVVLSLALSAASSVAVFGCDMRIEAEPPRVVHGHDARVVTPPSTIVSQPRLFYKGAYAYLWDDRWFYPTPEGWVYFRTEPAPLYEYRTRYAEARGDRPDQREGRRDATAER